MTIIYVFDRIYNKIGKTNWIFYLLNGFMFTNTTIKTKFDIYRVLTELSKTNPLFCSEFEFQFYLAWKIKEIYGNKFDIKIEYPTKQCCGHNRNIDLLLVDKNNNFIPIELKYKTSKFEQELNNFTYKLKNQSANDLSRYGHLKDISRIEYFKKTEQNFLIGYVVTITNQTSTWRGCINSNTNSYEFSLENGITIKKGIKNWGINTCSRYKETYKPIYLENDYTVKWQEYCNFNKKNGKFMILVSEVL